MVIYSYKIINKINNITHKGELDDSYMGSGVAIKKAILKYGKENFLKEIIEIYDNTQEAWEAEKKLVNNYIINQKQCYNMKIGGRGGWDHIDIFGDKNPMKNIETRKKLGKIISETRKNNPKFAEISRKNAIKGGLKRRGIKRPDHAKFMSDVYREKWKSEKFRKNFKEKNSYKYDVVSPCNKEFLDVYLTDICKEHNLPFVTLWCSSEKNGKIITKGKAKGWKCVKKIAP